jgi:hypothetical protein
MRCAAMIASSPKHAKAGSALGTSAFATSHDASVQMIDTSIVRVISTGNGGTP